MPASGPGVASRVAHAAWCVVALFLVAHGVDVLASVGEVTANFPGAVPAYVWAWFVFWPTLAVLAGLGFVQLYREGSRGRVLILGVAITALVGEIGLRLWNYAAFWSGVVAQSFVIVGLRAAVGLVIVVVLIVTMRQLPSRAGAHASGPMGPTWGRALGAGVSFAFGLLVWFASRSGAAFTGAPLSTAATTLLFIAAGVAFTATQPWAWMALAALGIENVVNAVLLWLWITLLPGAPADIPWLAALGGAAVVIVAFLPAVRRSVGDAPALAPVVAEAPG